MVNNLNSALTAIGLTQYEAKIYKTLTNEGISTAKDISNICGIPYGKIYEVITSLGKKGFIEILPTKPMKYRALDPSTITKSVKEEHIKKLNKAEKIILSELKNNFEKTKEFVESKGCFWVINGRTAVNKKMEELFDKARDHIYIYTTNKGIGRLKFYLNILKKIARTGVNIKISAPDGNVLKVFKRSKSFDLSTANSQLKNNTICIDGKEALIYEAVPDDENLRCGRDLGMWISNSSFTSFLENLFLTYHNLSKNVRYKSL